LPYAKQKKAAVLQVQGSHFFSQIIRTFLMEAVFAHTILEA